MGAVEALPAKLEPNTPETPQEPELSGSEELRRAIPDSPIGLLLKAGMDRTKQGHIL
jgi:hypothetical protein